MSGNFSGPYRPRKKNSARTYGSKRTAPSQAFPSSRASRRTSFLPLWLRIFVVLALVAAIILVLVFGIKSCRKGPSTPSVGTQTDLGLTNTFSSPSDPNVVQREWSVPEILPNPGLSRVIAHGAANVNFSENQINTPGVNGNEIFFSAGTGSVDSDILKKLYLYDLETKKETKIAESTMYKGCYYETLVNPKWIVWIETDHGTNNHIYVRNRETDVVSRLRSCPNGIPKLRLSDDVLIWMEQVEKGLDKLYMVDLKSQENITLFSFQDVATYGVSAPCVYDDWIVWAGPDLAQSEAERKENETSCIYYVKLGVDFGDEGVIPRKFTPKTYVHEPLFNGQVFVWIDSNKSPSSNLYISTPTSEPLIIASNITTYALGEDIVIYGKNEGIWGYIYSTGETVRLTAPGEKGIMPSITGRTVIWYNLSAGGDKDVLRYKMLSDENLYPKGVPNAAQG